MARQQELAVREKKEVANKEESTVPARYFVPETDIYETEEGLTLVMEMPGVEKKDVTVTVEKGIVRAEGRIDFGKYEGLEPVYAEYNIGHYARAFTLPEQIDPNGIKAQLADGVLTLTLQRAKEAMPRRIPIA
jgi:HSP20 family protein